MIKPIRSFFKFFLVSNIFIALATAMLCYEVQYLSTGTIELNWDYGLCVFFGTLSLYNLHRYVTYYRMRLIGKTDRFSIVAELGHGVLVLVIVAALSAAVYGWSYLVEYQVPLIAASIIAGLYVLPIILGKRLRDFGWIKLPALATVFTILTSLVPGYIYELPDTVIHWLCAQRFLFLLAITIPFDIRDAELDEHSGVKTIAHYLGRKNCIRLSTFLMLGTMLISTQLMDVGFYDLQTLLASILTLAIGGLLIVKLPKEHSPFYYLGALDGVLLLHGLMILASHVQF